MIKRKLYKGQWIELKMVFDYEMPWNERYYIYKEAKPINDDVRYFVDASDASEDVAFVIQTDSMETGINTCIKYLEDMANELSEEV